MIILNQATTNQQTYKRSELELGVLYKINGVDNPKSFDEYETLYLKARNGDLIFFEQGRAGVERVEDGDEDDLFIKAPVGTEVRIING
jgi:hypothetical protein